MFKKGYPHGKASLSSSNNTVIWEGRFTNGVTTEAPAEIQRIFKVFREHSFRSKLKL